MMKQKNENIFSETEYLSIAKATALVVCSWIGGMAITLTTFLVFLGLTGRLTSESTMIGQYEWLIHGVDVFIFLGFYKAISFFKERKLLNIIIVTVIVSVVPLIGLFWYPENAVESLISSAIIFGIMFAAYGGHLIVNKKKYVKITA